MLILVSYYKRKQPNNNKSLNCKNLKNIYSHETCSKLYNKVNEFSSCLTKDSLFLNIEQGVSRIRLHENCFNIKCLSLSLSHAQTRVSRKKQRNLIFACRYISSKKSEYRNLERRESSLKHVLFR
jgi:hypothetical protein